MLLQMLATIIALVLYDLLKIGYKTYIIKKNKNNLHKIIGDLIYSTKMNEDFWEDKE